MNNIEYSYTLNVFCELILFCVIINRLFYLKGKNKTRFGFIGLWCFTTWFSLYYRPLESDFWFTLDDFNYKNLYREHLEFIFVWIRELVNNNYLLWRFFVWGIASFFVTLTFKKLKVNSELAILGFSLFALVPCFYYLRNSLGFSILYYSVACFSMTYLKNRLKAILMFIVLFALSWIGHRSMPLYMLLVCIAMIVPLKKQLMLWLIIILPILYYFVQRLSMYFMAFEIWQDDSGLKYLEADNEYNVNWKGYIVQLISYLPFIYISYNYIKTNVAKKEYTFYAEKVYFLTFFFLMYLSFLFVGQGSIHLSMRFANTAMMPFALFIILYFKHNWRNKVCNRFIAITTFVYAFNFLLSLI